MSLNIAKFFVVVPVTIKTEVVLEVLTLLIGELVVDAGKTIEFCTVGFCNLVGKPSLKTLPLVVVIFGSEVNQLYVVVVLCVSLVVVGSFGLVSSIALVVGKIFFQSAVAK